MEKYNVINDEDSMDDYHILNKQKNSLFFIWNHQYL